MIISVTTITDYIDDLTVTIVTLSLTE
jgi:hypothetical protein